MNKIRKFILKDVRCFEGKQEFNIRPLTFLVGENSTGKSTVLGCMQALINSVGFGLRKDVHFDFNTEPYQMGAFADIARKVGGGRSERFELGLEMGIRKTEIMRVTTTLIERESGSEPSIEQLKIDFKNVTVIFDVKKKRDDGTSVGYTDIEGPSKSIAKNGNPAYTFKIFDEEYLFLGFRYFMFQKSRKKENNEHEELLKLLEKNAPRLGEYTRSPRFLFPPYRDLRSYSFAPIRSKPMRTYDPVRETEDPEGSGMPMTLMNMYRNDGARWKDMQKKLVEFGKASGLFTNINIKKHGRSVNDPFQLQIKVRGPQTNIIDVGYGIGQILPIVVRIFNARMETSFLAQQPEVHLHPKGQAELCSLLISIATQHKHSFVIETHSDAMIDRARIEIMKENIPPGDVSLIYLEPVKNKVEVHNITFDKEANLLGVPDSYRKFFLRESDKLLGFQE